MRATAFSGRRVLVTGGLGFLGSTLVRRLAGEGAVVTVIDCLLPEGGGNRFNLDGFEDRVDVRLADLSDADTTARLVVGQEFLFDLAARTSHSGSIENPVADLESNARGPLTLLEACRRHNRDVRIVFTSTRQVYGRARSLPVDEDHPLHPLDVNGIHKLTAERYHAVYGQLHGLRSCVLRLTNTYGPRMRIRDGRQNFLGEWIRRLVDGRPLEVWGGSQRRDPTFVDDAVEALILAVEDAACGQVFNVGGPEAFTLREIAEAAVACNGGGSCEVRPMPADRAGIDLGDIVVDSTRLRRRLGWQPRVTLAEGLGRSLDFYRRHRDRYA